MSTETKVPSRERVRELATLHAHRADVDDFGEYWRTCTDTAAALRHLEALMDAMPKVREALEAAKGSIAREYCVGCKLDNVLAILDGLEARDG